MFKRTMKKLACSVLAIASVTACMSTFTACETAHPEVEMTIEFNGKTYTLDYVLYRDVAPSTVNHFLWLAENGYYNGLCVHDYDAANKVMYTGGYSYDEEDGITYKDYYTTVAELNKKATANGATAFPYSVYADREKTNPLYTLYGEFEDNSFQVENGDKVAEFGALTMYYTPKTNCEDRVYVVRNDDDSLSGRDYKYNSATSQFYITLNENNTNSAAYCTFATLDEDSVSDLQELQTAIEAYIGAGDEEDVDFTTVKKVTVDEDDPYVGDQELSQSYDVPVEPIVIKSVTVSKY